MSDQSAYATYRRMFGSIEDGISAWWYLGATLCAPQGVPEIPGLQAETIMIHRTTTTGPAACRIDWWEIGVFRDPVTGEIATSWYNPLTGAECPAPSRFEEGPAHYDLRGTEDGVQLTLTQPHAHVHGIEVRFRNEGGRVHLWQTERKSRGFPTPDGTLPDPRSSAASEAITQLSVFAAADALAGPAPSVPSHGSYTFALSALPSWMGFGASAGTATVFGRMQKAEPGAAPLNPTAWARLKQVFPDRFDNDTLLPRWQA